MVLMTSNIAVSFILLIIHCVSTWYHKERVGTSHMLLTMWSLFLSVPVINIWLIADTKFENDSEIYFNRMVNLAAFCS